MSKASKIRLFRNIKIDGVDVEAGLYPIEKFSEGHVESIVSAGWAELTNAPTTSDGDGDAKPSTSGKQKSAPKTAVTKPAEAKTAVTKSPGKPKQ